MVLAWLLVTDAQGEPPASGLDVLQQFGLPTFVALVFVAVAWKLFNQAETSHAGELERIQAAHKAELERIEAAHKTALERSDAAYRVEVARGDRMETGLRDLNDLINTKLAGTVAGATDAIREALEMTRDRRRP